MSESTYDLFSKLIREGEYKKALHLAEKALEKTAEDPGLIGLRGLAKFYLKDINCLEDLDRAVALDPINPYHYSSRAYIKDVMGDTEAAVEDYLKAIELDPEDHIAHNNLGMLQEKLGRKQQAKSSFNAADKLLGIEKTTPEFPAENLQHSINAKKSISKWNVVKSTFTTLNGWNEFFTFVRGKLK